MDDNQYDLVNQQRKEIINNYLRALGFVNNNGVPPLNVRGPGDPGTRSPFFPFVNSGGFSPNVLPLPTYVQPVDIQRQLKEKSERFRRHFFRVKNNQVNTIAKQFEIETQQVYHRQPIPINQFQARPIYG